MEDTCPSRRYRDYDSYSIFVSASRCILVGAVTVDKSLNSEYHFLSTTDRLKTNLAAF